MRYSCTMGKVGRLSCGVCLKISNTIGSNLYSRVTPNKNLEQTWETREIYVYIQVYYEVELLG